MKLAILGLTFELFEPFFWGILVFLLRGLIDVL